MPAYWNEQFEQMSGLKVTKDAEGCLQDVHWSSGGIGYFPTYTLGNLNAAQLMQAARREMRRWTRICGKASTKHCWTRCARRCIGKGRVIGRKS